nr:hypothetical protein [uncultured Cellulosilyticum sp.]
MKKINSINVSGKVIGMISIFLVFLPLIFYCLRFIGLEAIGEILMKGSCTIGIIMLIGAWIVLMIELRQDKVLDQYYTSYSLMLKVLRLRTMFDDIVQLALFY